MSLRVTWHDHTSAIPDWLWRDCFRPPQQGLFWFRALELGMLENQFQLWFGLLSVDDAPIGIVPAFTFDLPLELVLPPTLSRVTTLLARGPLRRLAYQRTLFIGNIAGEEGQVGLLPGHGLGEMAAFIHDASRAKAAESNASMLVWKEFPGVARVALDGPLHSTLAFRMVSYPGTVIPLVSGGYQEFLGTQHSARRWKINDKLRRGAKHLALDTAIIASPSQTDLDEIFALFWQTYLRGKTKFERLTPAFFRAIADCDESVFVVQRDLESGRMLGFMLLLDLGERVINQFIGIDYTSTTGGYLYFRLFASGYDWACTTKATQMQSGQTGYMAKLDMGHSLVPLWNYVEHRNPLVNWVYRRVASTVTWDTLDEQLAEYLTAHADERVRT